MKRIALIILFINIFIVTAFSQILVPKIKNDTTPQRIHYFFGFSLVPTPNGSLTTFAIVRELRNGDKTISVISKSKFILQAFGQQCSKANPQKENFFKKHRVNPETLDEIWKLRYSQYPFKDKKEQGWSNKESIPSAEQMSELNKFGIYNMFSFCYGEKAFKLLQLIQNQSWVARYKGL